jgi:enoyl-CoA hydratase
MLRVGERRAKQAIWLNERWDAAAALRAGLVNWVVPGEDLEARCQGVVEKLLSMPPEALALSKDAFNFMADAAGESSVIRYHYMSHQFSHQTTEAQVRLRERLSRVAGGASAVRRETT